MRKKRKINSLPTVRSIAIIAFAAVMLFAITGCKEPGSGDDSTYGISLSQTETHTFATAEKGYTAPPAALTITVTNTGNQPTGALTAALIGTDTNSFTLTGASIASIAAGNTGSFTVQPKTGLAVKTHTATVTVDGANVTAQSFAVSFTVTETLEPITSVTINIDAPSRDAAQGEAATDDENYTITTVAWNPNHNPFQGGVEYTVTITLTAKDGFTFTGLDEEDITIGSGAPASVTNNGTTLVLTRAFPATSNKTVTSITIANPPNNFAYTHGDLLNLDGLTITITYQDDPEETKSYNELASLGLGINISPAHGSIVMYSQDGDYIKVLRNNIEEAATTNALAVSKKALTITSAAHTKTYDGTATATGVTVTLDGIISADTDNVNAASVIATYTGANAGTKTINITAVTLSGSAADNYTVTIPASVTVSGGITAAPITSAAITITAPVKGGTPATTASITGGANFSAGTVTWLPAVTTAFAGDTAYAASVTLTADSSNYTFTGLTSATINGETATRTNNTGATVTLTFTFPKTQAKAVTSIAITRQPAAMSYTHGDALNLTGLTLTINYDEGSPDINVAPAQFAEKGITTIPANGAILRFDGTYNNNKIQVKHSVVDTEETTANLVIGKKSVTITGVTVANKTYDGNANATIIDTLAAVSGKLAEDTVTVNTGSAAFAQSNAGNGLTVTFNSFSLGGTHANCYNLTVQPASVTANITRAAGATVTKPTVSATFDTIAATADINNESVIGTNDQGIEYQLLSGASGTTVAKVWQDSGTFGNLPSGTTYRVQARTKQSDNHNAGAANTSDAINTQHSTGISISMGNFTVTDAAAGKGVFNTGTVVVDSANPLVIDASELASISAWYMGMINLTPFVVDDVLTLERGSFGAAGNYTITITFTENGKPWLGSVHFIVE